ncbi:hypothetical protein [Rhodohalobacter sp. 614A]|uniref:hypothetical protein n=1 Tax=Rhodohalobacter sp. 614A TaxID=2908649 RepID=UPI001F3DBD34|nr:hypothetical protein [Rhodohalobacter sp. 614A]
MKLICRWYKYRKSFLLLKIFVVCLMVSACGDDTAGPDEREEMAGETHGLFLSVNGDSNGLYLLDPSRGAAIRAGDGKTPPNGNAGLASQGPDSPLLGASEFSLYEIERDGSGATLIGNPAAQALTEGLAYDPENNFLFASSNGFLHLRSPDTGETIETVLSPPNQPDIEGLAYDPETHTLYGLARGYEQQSQYFRGLYLLDTSLPRSQWEWMERGDTGGLWANAGLAFVPETQMLFAVGRMDDPDGLYSINPETGSATRIGSIGLSLASGGGLAWVPAN